MYIRYQLFGVGLRIGDIGRVLGGCAVDRSFVVEAVEIAPRSLEFFDPFLRLLRVAWWPGG